jgi:uracil-DNA glycosylase
MKATKPRIEESWYKQLEDEFNSDAFKSVKNFLKDEIKAGHIVYPPGKQMFAAFDHCPFDKTKVVIIGQDPYHGKAQANGLCFSVSKGIKKPPSLQNIFKELKSDLGYQEPAEGDLSAWAKQGVLLLNAILSVRAGEAGSHQNAGWEYFTNAVIQKLSDKKTALVFLLWGKFAHSKEELIDDKKHFILKAAHPSPFSANQGFMGCRHFSKTNEILKSTGQNVVNWNVS